MDLGYDQTSCESNINVLLTRNFPFDSDVRQWSHPFMIPLYCLWAKWNNRTRSQFECDVAWFCFYFDFVRSHAQCGCCSIVCWRGWRGEVRLKFDAQGQGVEWFGTQMDKNGGRGSWKLDNFHGRRLCIVQ